MAMPIDMLNGQTLTGNQIEGQIWEALYASVAGVRAADPLDRMISAQHSTGSYTFYVAAMSVMSGQLRVLVSTGRADDGWLVLEIHGRRWTGVEFYETVPVHF